MPPNDEGTNASMWARSSSEPRASSNRNWAQEKEPAGYAFRGLVKARGRGGGRGRGFGRGGHGMGTGDVKQMNGRTAPAISILGNKTDVKAASTRDTTSTTTSPPIPALSKPVKPTLPSRRNSQPTVAQIVPLLSVDTTNAEATDKTPALLSAVATQVRPVHNRRRSLQNIHTPSSSIISPTPAPNPVEVPIPSASVPSARDSAPLMASASSVDQRHNLDSLVEHVRAMAMEHTRSHSPATHIDWALEDDDTLPDLDDWVIKPEPPSEPVPVAALEHEPIEDHTSHILSPILEKAPETAGEKPVDTLAGLSLFASASALESDYDEIPDAPLVTIAAPPKGRRVTHGEWMRSPIKEKNQLMLDHRIEPESSSSMPLTEVSTLSDVSDVDLPVVKVNIPAASSWRSSSRGDNRTSQLSLRKMGVKDTASWAETVSELVQNTNTAQMSLHPKVPENTHPTTLPHHPSLPPKPIPSTLRSRSPRRGNMFIVSPPPRTEAMPRQATTKSGMHDSYEKPISSRIHAPKDVHPMFGSNDEQRGREGIPSTKGTDYLHGQLHTKTQQPASAPANLQVDGSPLSTNSSTQFGDHDNNHTRAHSAHEIHFQKSGPNHRSWSERSPSNTPNHIRALSSPQTELGTAANKARAHVVSRPVISFNAIQRISRSLGTDPVASR